MTYLYKEQKYVPCKYKRSLHILSRTEMIKIRSILHSALQNLEQGNK